MGVTKFVLRKPITTLLIILSVIFFGLISLINFKYELTPDINMPMYLVTTIYPGASPEDIDKNITKKIEEKVYNLQGAKTIQSGSRENVSIVAIQYEYSQNMDVAYNDLKKVIDTVKQDFNDSVKEPTIIEMDMNSVASVQLAVRNKSTTDIYNYVTNTFVKELEKISDVASIETSGGRENYIKIELKSEEMMRYNLSMSTIAAIVKNADFSYPAGTVRVGDRDLSFSTSVDYDTVESLKSIPIITGNKRTLYLDDIANIYQTKKDATDVGRYDGDDCMIVSIMKAQSSSAVDLSRKVKKSINSLLKEDPNLSVTIVNDQADNIMASIENVFQTMIIAIILSMFIIFMFFGDMKASLIVGTSIPFSILTALCCMYLAGFSLNLITLSALVLGVGMMVDNSIVVLEACFRAKENHQGESLVDYMKTVLESTNTVGFSVFGSTLTTVVVFLPIGFISGMAGQFFKPLAFTIVYCMLASFVSALTIVPLTYVLFKPDEKSTSPAGKLITKLQGWYRKAIMVILNHRFITIAISVVSLIVSLMLLTTFKTELVASADEGMIKISIETKPSLTYDAKDEIYKIFENYVKKQKEVDYYVLSNSSSSFSMSGSSSGQALIAYLVDERKRKLSTDELVEKWKEDLTRIPDCNVEVTSYSTSFTSTFVMDETPNYQVILESNDYDKIKEVNDVIKKKLEQRIDLYDITTTLDNGAPTIKAVIDPILAAAEGFTPAQVGATLYSMLSGTEIMDMTIDGETIKVMLEYPNTDYDTIDKVENISLTSQAGAKVTLKDIATITFSDSPTAIQKYNKMYRTTIKGYCNNHWNKNSKEDIDKNIVNPMLTKDVTTAKSTIDEMMGDEFNALYMAIAAAIFLVFVVMASQFESVRYSFMVMGTILFSFVGSFFFLWLWNLKLSMVVLLGMLMLVGTAVNNGILYVDTVNQFLDSGKDLLTSLREAGAIRLRPIMMTTFTTIVSMIPMSFAYGKNGEILQGLGVVDMGGLVSSTAMALFVLPVFYYVMSHKKDSKFEEIASVSKHGLD